MCSVCSCPQFDLPLEAVDKIIDEVVGPALDSYLKNSCASCYLLSASVGWNYETMQEVGGE